MTNLINCVEMLTGPDRKLDLEIWNAIFPDAANPVQPVRSFTGSLDAALMLVPAGWFGSVPINRNCDAWLRASNDSPIVYGRGKTPATALCSAALRARAAVMSAKCQYCNDSKIEFVNGGNGNVLEIECSMCREP